MRQCDMRHAKDWHLRQRITEINKALRGCAAFPTGMSSILAEQLTYELTLIRAEQQSRKTETV